MEIKNPLILTVRLDQESQDFFDKMRNRYFPVNRNLLKAHLTLFHQLPDDEKTFNILNDIRIKPFTMNVYDLRNLGAGVAYKVESDTLEALRKHLRHSFEAELIPQDKQGFRPHITIQNKTTPELAKELIIQLSQEFQAFKIQAIGLDVWKYLGGPWEHRSYYQFYDTPVPANLL
jgi:2'-5' RNA ligase